MADDIPPLCDACANFRVSHSGPIGARLCGVDDPTPLAAGSHRVWSALAMRSPDGRCGPEGLLFVARQS